MNGDAKFSRELCMGMPNSLGNFAWGCQIPCSVGDTKSTEGVPKSLGDLARGCQILGGAGSPMTAGNDSKLHFSHRGRLLMLVKACLSTVKVCKRSFHHCRSLLKNVLAYLSVEVSDARAGLFKYREGL